MSSRLVAAAPAGSVGESELQSLARQVARSKKVAFIVGAGISTASGIPDFRSSTTGLFASLREKNPELKITSGKDLFHSNLFQREDTTRAFYMMIAELKRMADEAEPTEMHKLMKDLDAAGKLFRIYTQNIDALEAKAGLSYGLGEWKQTGGGPVSPSKKGKGKAQAAEGGRSPFKKAKGKQRAVADDAITPEDPASSQESRGQQEQQHSEQRQGRDGLDYDGQPVASTSRLPATVDDQPPPASQPRSCQASSQPSTEYVLETSEGEHLADVSVASTLSSLSSLGEDDVEEGGGISTREIPETPEDDATPPAPSQPVVEDSMTMDLDSSDDESALDLLSLLASQSAKAEEPTPSAPEAVPTLSQLCLADEAGQASPQPDESLVAPTASQAAKTAPIRRTLTIPRVIPLHGTLDEMHCPKCTHTASTQQHLAILASGHSAYCPSCVALDNSRTALGERSRGIGVLKVSVVLYGEEHKQASRVGEITEKDLLKSARPDFLIVAGTTLKIPGVKKLVRELSRLVKQLNEFEEQEKDAEGNGTGVWHKRVTHVPRVIFMNMEAPTPEKSWNDVFDIHVQGDIQTFASMVRQELANPTRKPTMNAQGASLAPPPASAPPAFLTSAPMPPSSGLGRAASFSGAPAQPPSSKIKLSLENKHWIVSVPAANPAPTPAASLSRVEESAEPPSAPSSSAPATLGAPMSAAVPVERFFSSKPQPAPSPAPLASASSSQMLDQPISAAAARAPSVTSKARRPARQRPPTAAQIAAQYQSTPSANVAAAKGKGRAVLQQPVLTMATAEAMSAEEDGTISADPISASSTAAPSLAAQMAPSTELTFFDSQETMSAQEPDELEPGTVSGALNAVECPPSAQEQIASDANVLAGSKAPSKGRARSRPGKPKKAARSRASKIDKQKLAGKTAAVKGAVDTAKKAVAKSRSREQSNVLAATDAGISADLPIEAISAPAPAAAPLLPGGQAEPAVELALQPVISVPAKGWKGYVLAPPTQPKNADYWNDQMPEGSKRRRSGVPQNPPTPAQPAPPAQAAAAMNLPAGTAGEGPTTTPDLLSEANSAGVEAPAPVPPADASADTASGKQKVSRAGSKAKSSKQGSTKKNKKSKGKGKAAQKQAGAARQSSVLPRPLQTVQDAMTATTAASTPPSLTSDDSTEMDTEEARSVTEAALALSGPSTSSAPIAPLDKGKGRAVPAPADEPTSERTAPLVIHESQPSQPITRYYTPVPSEAGSVGGEVRAFQTWFNELQELDAIVHLAERRSTRRSTQGRGSTNPAIEKARLLASQKRIAAEVERSAAEQKKRAAEEESAAEEIRSMQSFLELDAFVREHEASGEAERARTRTARKPTVEEVAAREGAWREYINFDTLMRLAESRSPPAPETDTQAGPSTGTSAAGGPPADQADSAARNWAASGSSSAKRVKTAAPAAQAPPKKAPAKRGKKASRAKK